jgi:hypothetical protein
MVSTSAYNLQKKAPKQVPWQAWFGCLLEGREAAAAWVAVSNLGRRC